MRRPARHDVTVYILAKPATLGQRPSFARAAQLELLTHSLRLNWPEADRRYIYDPAGDRFNLRIHHAIDVCPTLFCAFLTDDGCFYRRVPHAFVCERLNGSPSALAFSLRLGRNTTTCYPTGEPQEWRGAMWSWPDGQGDFGYPGSVDAHVFRTDDLREMIADDLYTPNPTALEVALNARCHTLYAERRPFMHSDLVSSYVSVPVNRVSEQSGVRYGSRFPQPAELLAKRFAAGERIDLERTFAGAVIDAAHTEVEYVWTDTP